MAIICNECSGIIPEIGNHHCTVQSPRPQDLSHQHQFTVPIEWEYGYYHPKTQSFVLSVNNVHNKRVTKLRCSNCKEVQDV